MTKISWSRLHLSAATAASYGANGWKARPSNIERKISWTSPSPESFPPS